MFVTVLMFINSSPTLLELPESLWAESKEDIGLLNVTPVRVKVKSGSTLLKLPQYPLSFQQREGIRNQIRIYLEKGVSREVSLQHSSISREKETYS